MKRKTLYLLFGAVLMAAALSGCKEKKTEEATEAVGESTETEEEGNGETEEKTSGDKKEDKEDSKEDTAEDKKETSADAASDEAEATDSPEEESEPAEQIAVLFPNEEDWETDAEEMRSALESDGYESVLLYADDDNDTQVSQIEEMADAGVSAMVIAPVDAYGLSDILDELKDMEESIPVFSYDDLIMNTSGIKYYVTYGGRQIGQQIADAIVEKADLAKLQESHESKTIEFFMGSLDDTQALFLYNGLMEVLQPYLDDGTLVCRSEKTSFDDTGLLRWNGDLAASRLTDILEENYTDGTVPDIIVTGFDEAALCVEEALEAAGTEKGSENWPLISGVGCTADAVKEIASGNLAFSIFTDHRTLADQCEDMVNILLHGEDDPEVNDYEQYDNGVKIIGTYLCDPQLIDAENYEILIDNGYYTEAEVRPDPTATPVPTETPIPTVTPESTETPEVTEAPDASASPAVTESPGQSGTDSTETDTEPSATPKPTEKARTTLKRAS